MKDNLSKKQQKEKTMEGLLTTKDQRPRIVLYGDENIEKAKRRTEVGTVWRSE